jgi:hypothetical protein
MTSGRRAVTYSLAALGGIAGAVLFWFATGLLADFILGLRGSSGGTGSSGPNEKPNAIQNMNGSSIDEPPSPLLNLASKTVSGVQGEFHAPSRVP